MPTGLNATDRKLVSIAVALFVLLTSATVLLAPVADSDFSSVPSSYLSTSRGARAGFLLLQRLGVPVERSQESPLRLSQLGKNATFIIAEPAEKPSRAERRALRQFVEGGGRVLFCGSELPDFFPGVELRKQPVPPPSFQNGNLELPAAEPYQAVFGSAAIMMPTPPAIWQKLGPAQRPVFARAGKAVVVAWALGAGQVVWWASAAPLTNSGLAQAANLPVFLNSVGFGLGRHIYWDEYFHGERGSLWDYARRIPVLRWAALQFALFTCAALFTFSRRSGPILPAPATTRLSPLEFVDTLGGLYRRAKAASLAVDVNVRELRLQLTRRLGLPAGLSNANLAGVAAERLNWNGAELQQVLDQAEAASLPPSRALQLVRRLKQFTARLTSKS